MKKFVNRIVFGNDIRLTLLLVLGIVFTAAFACGESGGDTVPPDAELQTMVKNTTMDLANAVETEDFSRLYNSASKDFQATYTLEQTKNVYKTYIDNKTLVLPSLKSAGSSPATFSPNPAIRQEKGLNILVVSGDSQSKPNTVHFDYEYVWRDGGWKMLKLVLKVG